MHNHKLSFVGISYEISCLILSHIYGHRKSIMFWRQVKANLLIVKIGEIGESAGAEFQNVEQFRYSRSINVYETIGQYSHEHRPNKHIHRFYEYGNKTDLDIFMVNWPLSVISILQHLLCSFSVFVLSSFRSSSIHFVRNILSMSKSRTIRDRFIRSALIIHTIFRIVRGINTSESDGKS